MNEQLVSYRVLAYLSDFDCLIICLQPVSGDARQELLNCKNKIHELIQESSNSEIKHEVDTQSTLVKQIEEEIRHLRTRLPLFITAEDVMELGKNELYFTLAMRRANVELLDGIRNLNSIFDRIEEMMTNHEIQYDQVEYAVKS